MQPWQLLEQVFTVETIMIPYEDLLIWDRQEPLESIWAEAQKYKIDTIPVSNGMVIDAVLERHSDQPKPLTYDWTITRDTSIPMIIQLFNESNKPCLFVISGQNIIGIVTPADLNQLTSRTYFYNLMAELERRIATHIRKHFDEDKKIWDLIKDTEKQSKMQKKLADSSLELGVIHTLFLSDMVNIIKDDKKLREQLGFPSSNQVEK